VKITKQDLKKIIKEELQNILKEDVDKTRATIIFNKIIKKGRIEIDKETKYLFITSLAKMIESNKPGSDPNYYIEHRKNLLNLATEFHDPGELLVREIEELF
jgi:hypothetical protein